MGGKHSKVRLTGLAAGNAFGERLPMFVIGSQNLHDVLKGAKNIPYRYRSQPKFGCLQKARSPWNEVAGHPQQVKKFDSVEW